MPTFIPEEIDVSIQQDLSDEIIELYEASQQCLTELELTPHDKEVQRALFRAVHTIKGDLGLVGFAPMIAVLQDLEDILDLMRKDQIDYTTSMHDLVLGMLDMVNDFVKSCLREGKAEYNQKIIDEVNKLIRCISADNAEEHEQLIVDAIHILQKGLPKTSSTPKLALPKTGIPSNISEQAQQDLLFFRELMRPIEKRVGYKEGRGERIAKLALLINSKSQRKISSEQLAVACFVHDFGMAFMPKEVLDKTTSSAMDTNFLRSHVYKSTRLIEHLSIWDEARKIVMQHHENVDGSGYPLGLKGDEICEGAKLLAILDRYERLLHQQSPMSPKDAVLALNKEFKGQLSNYWLRLFNQVITKVI